VPIARIALAGLRKLPRGPEAVEGAVEDAGAHEISKLRRNLRLLYGVGAVAPMLGLLGTVWGMITAFQVASVQGLGKAEHLATGIYEALVTTFAGLLVAIPTVIFYYYFLSKIDALVHDMNELSIEFVEHTTDPDQDRPPAQAAQ
jgi:biopolymer transport protein ExbB